VISLPLSLFLSFSLSLSLSLSPSLSLALSLHLSPPSYLLLPVPRRPQKHTLRINRLPLCRHVEPKVDPCGPPERAEALLGTARPLLGAAGVVDEAIVPCGTLEAAEMTAILRVTKEAVRVTRDAKLQGGVGVGVVEQVEGGLDVVLPDEPVGSLRAGNEVGVDADVVGTLRDHGSGGAAR
jgi:hypothetical protein